MIVRRRSPNLTAIHEMGGDAREMMLDMVYLDFRTEMVKTESINSQVLR
jgi:hypothetical protein